MLVIIVQSLLAYAIASRLNRKQIRQDSFVHGLSRDKLINYIQILTSASDLDRRGLHPNKLTQLWQQEGLLKDNHQAICNLNTQHGHLNGGVVVLKGINKFLIAFNGVKTFAEAGLCAVAAATHQSHLPSLSSWLIGTVSKICTETNILESTDAEEKRIIGEENCISGHSGIRMACLAFLDDLKMTITEHYVPGLPISFELVGHSMGGAKAFYIGWYLKRVLAQELKLSPEEVRLEIVTFASAGFFSPHELDRAESIIGRDCAINFTRLLDCADLLTRLVQFENPTVTLNLQMNTDHVYFDEHHAESFLRNIVDWSDPALKILQKVQMQDHEYPKWKEVLRQYEK